MTKLTQDLHELSIPKDLNKLTSEWLSQFSLFASEIAQLRFTPMQGYAFKIIRRITKYDQFLKRDGSVISVLKEDGKIITDEHSVHALLINYLAARDQSLQAYFPSIKPPPET